MDRFHAVMRSALLAASIAAPSIAGAQVVEIAVAPPPLPVYEQPPIPGSGYIWTPGYWAYGPEGYYWVPGTWVRPPTVGLLWTPGYWGWRNGLYAWNAGYWGPRVGYYGGINYGYGYVGNGYAGGYWSGNAFSYNRAVNNFGGVTIANVYSRPVVVSPTATLVSYNGGVGGLTVRPTPQQITFANQQHIPATALQTQHQTAASTDKALLATTNNGRPAVAATTNAGQLTGTGVVGTKGATPMGGGVGGAGGAGAGGAAGAAGGGATGVNALSKVNTNVNANTNTNTNIGTNNALPKGTQPKGNTLSTTTTTTNANTNTTTNTNTRINALPKNNTLSTTTPTGGGGNSGGGVNTRINALPKATGGGGVGGVPTNANTLSNRNVPRANLGGGGNAATGGGGGVPKGVNVKAAPKGVRP